MSQFLKEEHRNEDLRRGVQRKWLKEEWNDMLKFVQLYITYEGRKIVILLYHCHRLVAYS